MYKLQFFLLAEGCVSGSCNSLGVWFGSHGTVTRIADGICVSALLLEDEKLFLMFRRGDAILFSSKHVSCSLKYLA
jgi:hypothetical protein